MKTRELEALRRAIKKLGGQSALARACGVKQAHVWNWLNKSCRVPADYAISVETATRGAVTRHELRPDIFGEPPRPEQNNAARHTRATVTPRQPAESKKWVNAHITAQIVALEAKQHRAVREVILNRSGAAERLAELDLAIEALRTKLRP